MELKPTLICEGNIFYGDELNLLTHYIVEIIFDTAVSGWNGVRKEGTPFVPSPWFVLAGSCILSNEILDPILSVSIT